MQEEEESRQAEADRIRQREEKLRLEEEERTRRAEEQRQRQERNEAAFADVRQREERKRQEEEQRQRQEHDDVSVFLWLLSSFGLVWTFYFFWGYETSVSTSNFSERVENIGKLAHQQQGVIIGIGLVVISAILIAERRIRRAIMNQHKNGSANRDE
jgi:cation transport ATPase